MPWLHWESFMAHATLTVGLLLTAALLAGVVGQLLRLPRVTSLPADGHVARAVGARLDSQGTHRADRAADEAGHRDGAVQLGLPFPPGADPPHRPSHRQAVAGRIGRDVRAGHRRIVAAGGPLDHGRAAGCVGAGHRPGHHDPRAQGGRSRGFGHRVCQRPGGPEQHGLDRRLRVAVPGHPFLLRPVGPIPARRSSADCSSTWAGSVLLGVVAGLVVGYRYALVAEARRLVLLAGVLTLVMGICMVESMPYLLAFLAMGLTVANTSYNTRQILAELDRLTGLLCVVFFVTHGADLKIALLRDVGWIGGGYLVFRTAGKYFAPAGPRRRSARSRRSANGWEPR